MTDPIIKRGTLRTKVGVEVDELAVTLFANDTTMQGNQTLAEFTLQGGFDGATLTVRRYFAGDWAELPAGNLVMFVGRVADIEVTGTAISMMCKSNLELLNIKMPRNLFMAQCIHTLYDEGCAANRAAFTSAGNVTIDSSRSEFTTDLAQADGFFNLGVITFTSGENVGESRTVKSYASNVVSTMFPFQYLPLPGDTFDIVPGCDKTTATCNSVFNNVVNFRGFPFIPVPESSV